MLMAASAIGTMIWLLIKDAFSAIGVGTLAATMSLRGTEIDNHRFLWWLVGIEGALALCAYIFKLLASYQFPNQIEAGAGVLAWLLGSTAVEGVVGFWAGKMMVQRVIKVCNQSSTSGR